MKFFLPLFWAACLLPSSAGAALLSQDAFSAYAIGQLPALLPSPTINGYAGDWTGVDFGNQRPAITEGTLFYPDPAYQPATGRKVSVPSNTSGGEINAANSGRAFRLLDATLTITETTADTRYLSFLFQSGQETGGTTYQTLALYNTTTDDANRIFQFGIYGAANYQFGADGVETVTGVPTDTNVHLIVAKFVTSATAASDTVTVWIDPDLSAGEPSTGGLTVTGRNLRWDRLAFSDYEGNSAAWDEIRWGTTFGSVTTESFFPAVPTFVLQPVGLTTGVVDTALTLTAEAVASPAISAYLWEKSPDGSTGWTPVPGATGSSLAFVALTVADKGFYRVKATNANGTTTSSISQLNVTFPPPIVSEQPTGTAVQIGSSVQFSVSAFGVGNVTYQWLKDGDPLPGKTESTLLLTNVQLSDAGSYIVRVTDDAAVAAGEPAVSVNSTAALLEVFPAWSGLVSAESFDPALGYTEGELPSQTPAITGYTGPWTDVDFGDAEPAVTPGSLTLANSFYLGSTGHKVSVATNTTGGEITGANSGRAFRVLSPALRVNPNTTGIRYLSFLFQSGQETGPTTYQTLALYNGNTADSSRTFDIGIINNETQYNFGVQNIVNSSGVSATTATRLMVVRFELNAEAGSDNVTVWVDPLIGNGEPLSGGVTVSNTDFLWDRLAFSDYDGNSASWDEIRWGSTFDSVTITSSGLPVTPVFALHPLDRQGEVGDEISLISNAVADPAVTLWQWEKSANGTTGWAPVSGATSPLLEFIPVSYADNGFYRLSASNANGSAASNAARISVTYPLPEIAQQPLPAGVSVGSNVTFSVIASGLGNLTYQWRKDGNPLPGETAATLSLTNVQAAAVGNYTVLVTDEAALASSLPGTTVISNPAALTIWAGLVSHDAFAPSAGYVAGELPAQNPAIGGYTGPWTDIDFGDAEPGVSTGSLVFGDPFYLASSGDRISVATTTGAEITGANSGRVFRLLDPVLQANANSSGDRYLSFLFQSGQETGPTTYQTLALYNNNTADANRFFDIGLTFNGNQPGTQYNFGILNNYTSTGVDADARVRLIVVKFSMSPNPGEDSATVWVDPILSGGEPVGGTFVSALDLAWDRIAFSDYDGNSAAWDEIRWGSTFASVTLNPNPTNTFVNWIFGYPGVGARNGFNDDADDDGIVNGLEHVFGTDPTVVSQGISQLTFSGNILTFQHPSITQQATNVTSAYLWSTDLAIWHENGVTAGGTTVNFAATPQAGLTSVAATLTGTIPGKIFVGLRATLLPP